MAHAETAFTLSATPEAGVAPLSVTFRGGVGSRVFFGGVVVDFGDGNRPRHLCEPGMDCQEGSVTHVYEKPGTYVAKMLGRGEGPPRALREITISVR